MKLGYRCTKYGVLLVGVMSLSPLAQAECRVNSAFNRATHYLVNGVWKTPSPEIVFKVPGNSVGDGSLIWPDSLSYAGGGRTLPGHVRFRLAVKGKSSTAVGMYFDSSSPLSCVGCTSAATISMAKIGWIESVSSETRGNTPGNGQLTGGPQSLITGPVNSDNMFNLRFNFANDTIYPAGTYTGEFVSQGIPK